MGDKIKKMVITILVLAGTIFVYHISFIKEFCKENTRNYLVVKIKEKKCAKGLINSFNNNYETKKLSILPPWAK
ncbi:MAG: hypothetical protein ACO2O6_06440 [Candidatus Hydrothermia bacterium]|jgi:hypothetical protein